MRRIGWVVRDEGVRRHRQQHVGLTLGVASHGQPPGYAPAASSILPHDQGFFITLLMARCSTGTTPHQCITRPNEPAGARSSSGGRNRLSSCQCSPASGSGTSLPRSLWSSGSAPISSRRRRRALSRCAGPGSWRCPRSRASARGRRLASSRRPPRRPAGPPRAGRARRVVWARAGPGSSCPGAASGSVARWCPARVSQRLGR